MLLEKRRLTLFTVDMSLLADNFVWFPFFIVNVRYKFSLPLSYLTLYLIVFSSYFVFDWTENFYHFISLVVRRRRKFFVHFLFLHGQRGKLLQKSCFLFRVWRKDLSNFKNRIVWTLNVHFWSRLLIFYFVNSLFHYFIQE